MQLVDVAHRSGERFAIGLEVRRRVQRFVPPDGWEAAVPEVEIVADLVEGGRRSSKWLPDEFVETSERRHAGVASQIRDARPARGNVVVEIVRRTCRSVVEVVRRRLAVYQTWK